MIEVSTLHVPAIVVVGFLSGVLYARRLHSRNPDLYVVASVVVPVTVWVAVIAVNTTGLTPLVDRTAVALPVAVAVPYVLSYPLWFRAGGELAFVLFGRRPDQGGLVWVFRLDDDTAAFDPSWHSETEIEDDD